MPSSFKFWIMHFTTFCLCLYPESDSPVEDFLVRKHCGTKFWESLSLFTRRNLVVILEALKVENSWEYCFDGEFYVRSSFSHLFKGLPLWLRWLRICQQCKRPEFDSWVRKISWSTEWLPNPVLLPGEAHGQRSLVGYSPWVHIESDTTEQLTPRVVQ